jgi:hypothetical protein
MVYESGERKGGFHGRRIGLGGKRPRAVVMTVTVNGTDAPVMFTDEVEGLQVDWLGAPLQLRLTPPVNPEIEFT